MVSNLSLLALPIILILYFKLQTQKFKKLHPPGLPFCTNSTPDLCLSKQIISLKLGLRRVVVISSADVVKQIVTSHDAVFFASPVLVSQKRLSYNGIEVAFSPYKEVWREMRKISTIHLFSTEQLQSFRPIFKDEVSKIAMDASLSTVTDLSEMMVSYANNSICRVALGKIYRDEGYGKRNHFFDLLRDSHAAHGGLFVEDFLPPFRWMDRLSGMAAKLEKNFRELDSLYEELIEEHLNPNTLVG